MSAGKIITIMFLFLIGIVGVIGAFVMASGQASSPYTDSYGDTTSNQTNSTQDLVIKTSSATPQIGVAALFVLGAVLVILAVMVAMSLFSSRQNYQR